MPMRTGDSFPPYAGTFRAETAGNPRAGCCTLCRTSKVGADRPCVELGKNARPFREGMVVLCFNCAQEVGRAVGMLPAAREAELVGELAEANREIGRLGAELEAFGSLRDSLERLTEGAGR